SSYDWPGNVRELANAVERAVVMTTSNQILPEDLPDNVRRQRAGSSEVEPAPTTAGEDRPLRVQVGDFEAEVIRRALTRHQGNRARTAAGLGISRRALLYKLQEYGIS
ncbi:two-component system response regulator, partial [Rubrivivax gelatinosus]|nr:two-component system response regulator [Rubrivivax gelatinosus]